MLLGVLLCLLGGLYFVDNLRQAEGVVIPMHCTTGLRSVLPLKRTSTQFGVIWKPIQGCSLLQDFSKVNLSVADDTSSCNGKSRVISILSRAAISQLSAKNNNIKLVEPKSGNTGLETAYT